MYDEHIKISGFGVYNILHMLMSGVILMGMIMQSLALGYILPVAQCDLKLTLQQRGWLSAIPFLGKKDIVIVFEHGFSILFFIA